MDFDLDAVDDTTKLDGFKVRTPKKRAGMLKKVKKKVPTKRKAIIKKLRKLVKKAAKKLPKRKSKKNARPIERTERLDMRITKAQKVKLARKAAGLKRTVTSVVLEAIDRMPGR